MVGASIGTIGNKGKIQDIVAKIQPPCILVNISAIVIIGSLEHQHLTPSFIINKKLEILSTFITCELMVD
jgi:hypothetical protein